MSPVRSSPAPPSPQGWRLPAREIEHAVTAAAARMLGDRSALVAALREAQVPASKLPAALAAAASAREKLLSETDRGSALTSLIERVELRQDGLSITLSLQPLLSALQDQPGTVRPVMTRSIPLQMRRRGQEMRLVIESAGGSPATRDPALRKVVVRARRWFEALASGQAASLVDIARRDGVSDRYVGQLLPLAFLAPAIVDAIGDGTQPPHLTAKALIARAARLPVAWSKQASDLR